MKHHAYTLYTERKNDAARLAAPAKPKLLRHHHPFVKAALGAVGLTRRAFFAGTLGLAALMIFSPAKADILAGWDVTGLASFGASPLAPAVANANVTVVGLTRGSGVTTSGSAAASAWGGNGFTSADEGSAISSGDFGTFTITAKPGNMVSCTTIPAYNIRRSGTGPTTGIWQYQVGAGTFTDIGSPITWGSTTSSAGNNQAAIDLSGIADLQNVPPGTTITFRVVNWSGAAAGTWYINTKGAGDDFEVQGTVSPAAPPAPVVTAATSILSTGFTANWNASTGATGYRLDVSLADDFGSFVSVYNDLDLGNITSSAVTSLTPGTTYYYRLRAYNASGTSVNSTTNSVTTSFAGTPSMTVTLPGQTSPNTGVPTPQTAGTQFAITLTATTDGTTTDTTYSGLHVVNFSGPTGSPTYPANVNFVSGTGTADITLTKAEATSITATDGVVTGVASSSLTVGPGAIASYAVTAAPAQTVGIPFAVTVAAKDTFNNTVTTDSSTSVTLTSASGNVVFDVNPGTLVSGAFTVNATGNAIEGTTITAADANSKTGTSSSIVISAIPQYRSKQDGNWNDANTWEISTDGGTTWANASGTPTALDSTNTIQNSVTITANVSLDQVVIVSGGTLVMSAAFGVNDGPGDDIDVQSGGVFALNAPSTPPVFATGSTAKIETGGTLRVNASGLTANGAGANLSNFVYGNASVLEYNSTGSFSASGVTFFANVDANTVPIFRNAKSTVSVGGGSPTVINGIFEVAPGLTVTWNSAGTKTFRNGIRGEGNVTQGSTSGQFIINGATAELGGAGALNLGAAGLQIDAASVTTLTADKTLNTAAGAMTVNGVLDLNTKTLTGDLTVASGGTLKGSGTLAGTATVSSGGIVSPGSSIGMITFGNAPALAGTVQLEIDRSAVPNADEIAATSGTVAYGGNLVVSNVGQPLQGGESFTLFAGGGFSGTFDNITLPALAPGLSWDTNSLLTTGVLAVIGAGGTDGGALAIQSSAGGVQLNIAGTAGLTYQLQYTDSLSPANWQSLGDTFVMPVANSTNIVDVSGGDTRYYRTMQVTP